MNKKIKKQSNSQDKKFYCPFDSSWVSKNAANIDCSHSAFAARLHENRSSLFFIFALCSSCKSQSVLMKMAWWDNWKRAESEIEYSARSSHFKYRFFVFLRKKKTIEMAVKQKSERNGLKIIVLWKFIAAKKIYMIS